MTLTAIARRYAGALFDVSEKQGSSAAARESLASVRALLADHADLKAVFASPAVSLQNKRKILDAVLAKTSGLSVEVTRLLAALADRDRLALIDAIGDAFEVRLLDRERIVHADVVTAVPLDADRAAALATALGKAVGCHVKIDARVDPLIMGGVIARVGSVVYDGSVARQLQKMKEQLASGV